MATRDTDLLIDGLVADARPVTPLGPPLARAATWLALAIAIVAIVVWWKGLRHDLAPQFANPVMLLEWIGAITTGVLAAIATFQLSVPDRSIRWLLLPVPAMVLWIGGLSVGGLHEWLTMGSDMPIGTSWGCLMSISLTSIPLGIVLLVMVRHAGYVRPAPTALAGGLAVASLSSAGLSLYHHLDTAIMVLIWHIGTVGLVASLAWVAGERLFGWINART